MHTVYGILMKFDRCGKHDIYIHRVLAFVFFYISSQKNLVMKERLELFGCEASSLLAASTAGVLLGITRALRSGSR